MTFDLKIWITRQPLQDAMNETDDIINEVVGVIL